jgi:hypothetical protein
LVNFPLALSTSVVTLPLPAFVATSVLPPSVAGTKLPLTAALSVPLSPLSLVNIPL